MTKKPSEKNKAWEKGRRDRLNKAFEELAELLPQYDPTINWSKNEIIQKSVSHIKSLHEKHRNFLTKTDKEALSLYDELVECIKFLQTRSKQLAELLTKAKITIPVLKPPKFLLDNPTLGEENNFNNINIQSVGRPKKYANKLNQIDGDKNEEGSEECLPPKHIESTETSKNNEESSPISSKSENEKAAVIPESVPTQNSQEKITGVVSSGLLIPVLPYPVHVSQPPIPPLTPFHTKNISPSFRKCKIISFHTLQRNVKLARDKSGRIKILPRPGTKLQLRKIAGKLPIPKLKKNESESKISRKRKKKSKNEEPTQKSKEENEPEIKKLKSGESVEQNTEATNSEKPKDEPQKADKENTPTEEKSQINEAKIEEKADPPEPATADMPSDYFASLQIPHSDSNSECVSPTAAFLLSFPVVAPSNGKNQETSEDNAFPAVDIPNEKREDTSANAIKPNSAPNSQVNRKEKETALPSTSDSFDTLNTFFTTQEYHQFCARNNEQKINVKKEPENQIDLKNVTKNRENASATIATEFKPPPSLNKIEPMENVAINANSRASSCSYNASSSNVDTNALLSNNAVKQDKQNSDVSVPLSTAIQGTTSIKFDLPSCPFKPPSVPISTKNATVQPSSMSSNPHTTWAPHVTTEYKTSFTFSLTPPIMSHSTGNKSNSTTNTFSGNKSFSTLPLPISSETVTKSNFDYFEYSKVYNQCNTKNLLPTTTSYASLNFTFTLTNPGTTVTTVSEAKPIGNNACQQSYPCANDEFKYQTYPAYGFGNQSQSYTKDCTSFTFALTTTTKTMSTASSNSTTFSIDNTIAATANCSSTIPKKTPIVSSRSNSCAKTDEKISKNANMGSKNVTNKEQNFMTNTKPVTYRQQELSQKFPQKNHVNWMTSETSIPTIDYGSTQATTNFFAPQIPTNLEAAKKYDASYPHVISEDNYPAWSPNKTLDNHTSIPNYYSENVFNSNTYPSGNTFNNSQTNHVSKMYGNENVHKAYKHQNMSNQTSQANFFSVSQLVDQGSANTKNFGSCAKKSSSSSKPKDNRRVNDRIFDQKAPCRVEAVQNNFSHQLTYSDQQKSIHSSVYSAEALISKKEKHRNFSQVISTDFYNVADTTHNTFIPASDNMDHNSYNTNYFYNYAPNQSCAQQSEYVSSYNSNVNYEKSNSKPSYTMHGNAKPQSDQKIKEKSQVNANLPPVASVPAPTNIMPYDPNYFPVPLAVNSPLISSGGPTTEMFDPHHGYSHPPNFQHNTWNSKNSFPAYHHSHFQQVLPIGGDSVPQNVNASNSHAQVTSGNLTNFNLSTICPEINDKTNQSGAQRNISGISTGNLQIYP